MKVSSLVLTISLASILSVALFSTIPNEAFAQEEQFDYRCYNVNATQPDKDGTRIKLTDQFGTATHTIGPSEEFCNPAIKFIPNDPNAVLPTNVPHLRCWTIDDQGLGDGKIVDILDQFFAQTHEHTLGAAVEFCHTVNKAAGSLNIDGVNLDPDLPFAGSMSAPIQNWKCYSTTGDPPLIPDRELHDQFTRAATQPGIQDPANDDPRFPNATKIAGAIKICTPAIKNYNPTTGPIPSFIQDHMICYDLLND